MKQTFLSLNNSANKKTIFTLVTSFLLVFSFEAHGQCLSAFQINRTPQNLCGNKFLFDNNSTTPDVAASCPATKARELVIDSLIIGGTKGGNYYTAAWDFNTNDNARVYGPGASGITAGAATAGSGFTLSGAAFSFNSQITKQLSIAAQTGPWPTTKAGAQAANIFLDFSLSSSSTFTFDNIFGNIRTRNGSCDFHVAFDYSLNGGSSWTQSGEVHLIDPFNTVWALEGFSPPAAVTVPAGVTALIRMYIWADALSTPSMTYLWDFGDGNTSTDEFPDHVYAATGTYNVKLTISSATCSQSVTHPVTVAACALPIELMSFTGSKYGDINVLSWTTVSEKDNNYFLIERSINGIDFIPIGTVKGHKNSSSIKTYFFNDKNPSKEINYYRFKQVDVNSAFSYSNTIAIENNYNKIDIYPNPNNGAFNINLPAAEQSYQLDITDIKGSLVYSISGHSVPETIQLNNLNNGVYIISFHIDNNTIIKKLVIY